MGYRTILGSKTYTFSDLKTLMAKASPLRSGDELAGVAASTQEERIAAQMALADLPLREFLKIELVPAETDEVSRLIFDSHEEESFSSISSQTVGEFRDFLLNENTDTSVINSIRDGITPEMAAAVSKLMSNQDLVLVAKKSPIISKFRNTIGLPGRLSTRLQPNHPTDDPKGIAASILDGLYLGSGDAVIGINPATDNVPTVIALLEMLDSIIQKYSIPTQSCILSHVTTSIKVMEQGAPLDLVFQSIGGTEALNRSFGVNLSVLGESRQMALELGRGTVGNNVMYFETGQGSALSAGAHHGVDQQTLEVRAYAVAKKFEPLLVNTVVGFIGPEYLYNGKQILRAGLEDHFCGKLLGLPMGVDICYTNHADADQDDMDVLLTLLGAAGCNYIMGVPGADDVMLSYQSTSFHDALYLRQLFGLRPSPEFEEWLLSKGIFSEARGFLPNEGKSSFLLEGILGENLR
ncbi:ethanolamine ammonia-lyase subunit EutB [Leptospira wolffii]|uniref:ethanolamine ammonia-lyase subunit EutB n=1 Tax=Leptospira wolffii TaxID=409998 RepID=UPI0003485969|nr:ethanolamine ammonia-lyase subunit EutB [Leptospira wolffii]TGK62240.1 ethanolamine ammonia-lyase subunit EutB [Leptospira wolffii]TGK68242.1 ethanolamine ammonia-lyase subunit EutB [Leptospira wolffii]TGK74376.1 ethanolamine ammonia-lyase subunit EutB [Leptospira wolffii]TGL32049.1 ethanolamine ammonia-lyase subunit EutB [Leptospira wolffii]